MSDWQAPEPEHTDQLQQPPQPQPYGQPYQQPYLGYSQPSIQQPNGMAIASMVCGIVSIPIVCIWFLSGPLAITAIILGFVAKSKIARGEGGGNGMATTGIACGAVTVGIFLVAICFFAFAIGMSHHR